jgi:hypothetical protein
MAEATKAKIALYGTSQKPVQTLSEMMAGHADRAKANDDSKAAAPAANGTAAPASPAPAADGGATTAPAPGAAGASAAVSPAPSQPGAGSPTPAVAGGGSPSPAASPAPSAGASPAVNGSPAPAAANGSPAPSPAPSVAPPSGPAVPSSPYGAAPGTDVKADRSALMAGVTMIKIPKWGDPQQRTYKLIESKRPDKEKDKDAKEEMAIYWDSKGKSKAESTFFIPGCTLYKGTRHTAPHCACVCSRTHVL